MKKWKILANIILEIAVFVAVCVLAIIYIPKLLGFFWPFVASMILSALATPLCAFLEKRIKLNKKWSSALILILVIVGITFCGYLGISKLVKEMLSLLSEAPLYYHDFLDRLRSFMSFVSERISIVSPDIGSQIEQRVSDFITQSGGLLNDMAPQGVEVLRVVASNVTNGLLGVVVMILSSYFFIADKDKISADVDKFLPSSVSSTIRKIKNHIMGALGGFVKAQFKIMFIIFVILLIGFLIMRNPYALLLALLIAFLDLLPILGTGTVLIPWAVISLLSGNFSQTIFLIVLYIICLLARQLLQPKIIGDSVGLDTLPTLVLIYMGYKLAGMKGMILALLIGVVFITLYRIGLFDRKLARINRLFNEYIEYDKENEDTSELQ